jgi:hypothetical protein
VAFILAPPAERAGEQRLAHLPAARGQYRPLGLVEVEAGRLPVEVQEFNQTPALARQRARAREQAAHAAGLRQATLDYRGLARALAIEGVAAERAGDKLAAADFFLRAGRSAATQGDETSARNWLRRAISLAPTRLVGRDAADLLRDIDKSEH